MKQRYRCLMIPALDDDGFLPVGEHESDFVEVRARFAWNDTRVQLLNGFERGCAAIWQAGGGQVWIDGSFVTSKEIPGDFDACWDHRSVDFALLDPVLMEFGNDRAAQKLKFGGEFFPNIVEAGSGLLFADFFQIRKDNGDRKGIIQLKPGGRS
jgi:hypothetical protein